jgi:hypothetical protein
MNDPSSSTNDPLSRSAPKVLTRICRPHKVCSFDSVTYN